MRNYNYWKTASFVLLTVISVMSGFLVHFEVLRYNVFLSIKVAVALAIVTTLVQVPALVSEYLQKRKVNENE